MQKEKYTAVKSYDIVNWAYPEGYMEKLGFTDKCMQRIMRFVKSVKYFVRYNGNLLESFFADLWFRTERPPLSLTYLFHFVADGLS